MADGRDPAGLAAWAITVAVALGGAAARTSGWAVGFPSWWALAGVGVATALLAASTERRTWRLGLGLLPPTLIVLVGLPWTVWGAFSGGPLVALALGAAAAMLGLGARPWTRRALLPAAAALALAASVRVQQQVGPEGDEPHYLMVADSVLRDGDLALESDYAQARYRAFMRRPIEPHYRVRGRDGEIYSLHALGLSLLVLPGYAAAGYPGASLLMAALAVLLVAQVRSLARAWLEDERVAQGVAWIVALGAPLAHYAGLVFTEVPAALAVAFALRVATDPRCAPGRALAAGVALAALPWLNVRYALLSVIVAALALSARPAARVAAAWIAPGALSALAIGAYHQALYGFFDPRRVYGRRREFSLDVLPTGLPGLFLDQEFGLFVYAPVLALAVPGLVVLARRRRAAALASAALIAAVVVVAACWPMWRGGFNPPGRFLVPLLPVLAVAAGAWLSRGLSAPAALLAGWTVWAGVAGVADRALVHRDRDGTAPLFRAHSGAVEWTRLLPGFVLDDSAPGRVRLSAVWLAVLGAAVLARRTATAPRLALSTAAAVGAAALAGAITPARSEGRDAVRVLGRPAMTAPGWRPLRDARWTPAELAWGPLYEPHRHPAGAVVGSRLPLAGGAYRLEIVGEGPGAPPEGWLEVRPDAAPAGTRVPLRAEGPGWAADLVLDGRQPVTLALLGGGPLLLAEVRLIPQPSTAQDCPKD